MTAPHGWPALTPKDILAAREGVAAGQDLAPPLLLLAAPPGCVPGEHLLHLPVEPQLLEQGALLAADLVRGRCRLAALLQREDVGR